MKTFPSEQCFLHIKAETSPAVNPTLVFSALMSLFAQEAQSEELGLSWCLFLCGLETEQLSRRDH